MTRLLPLLFLVTLGGCATWVAPLSDRAIDQDHRHRTLASRLEDQAIEYKTQVNVVRDRPGARDSRVVAVSWNGQLLLAGQVPSAEVRQRVEQTARDIRRVVHVHNELVIGPKASAAARITDAWITTQVKSTLIFTPDIPARRVKVVTENGVVYLMGLLTREEGETVVNAVRNTRGAQKIVKIFEYIPAEKARGRLQRPEPSA